MGAPDLKIVFKRKAPASKEGAESDNHTYGEGDHDEGEGDADGDAKLESFRKLASALGVQVKDEGAAMEAFDRYVYHCTEG